MRSLFKVIGAFCCLLGVLVLTVSFTPFVPWLARDINVDWFEGDADVLVVLGGSMLVDGTGPQATLGYDSYLRCVYAAWLMQRYRFTYVVLSGPDGLADAMAKFLVARGAKPSQLLIEDSARTTFQNAEFVKKILDQQPGLSPHPKVAILTSDYHARRAQLTFQHFGLPVRVIPVPDVAKRIGFPFQRWDAFVTLSDEFLKYEFYKVNGKI